MTLTCLLLLVSFVFSNVDHNDTRMEILFYIAYSIFSGSMDILSCRKETKKFVVFLSVLHIRLKSLKVFKFLALHLLYFRESSFKREGGGGGNKDIET